MISPWVYHYESWTVHCENMFQKIFRNVFYINQKLVVYFWILCIAASTFVYFILFCLVLLYFILFNPILSKVFFYNARKCVLKETINTLKTKKDEKQKTQFFCQWIYWFNSALRKVKAKKTYKKKSWSFLFQCIVCIVYGLGPSPESRVLNPS